MNAASHRIRGMVFTNNAMADSPFALAYNAVAGSPVCIGLQCQNRHPRGLVYINIIMCQHPSMPHYSTDACKPPSAV